MGDPPPRSTSIAMAGRLRSEQVADIKRDGFAPFLVMIALGQEIPDQAPIGAALSLCSQNPTLSAGVKQKKSAVRAGLAATCISGRHPSARSH